MPSPVRQVAVILKAWLVLVMAVVATACGNEGDAAPAAGVPAPTTTATAPLFPVEVTQRVPDLIDDSAQLLSVAHVALDAAGGLIVADTATMRVRRFTRTGVLAATLGEAGVGPGQFRSIDGIASAGDTIFVWDTWLWRISAFDSTGTLLSTRRAEPRAASLSSQVARAADGSWLMFEQSAPTAGASNAQRAVTRIERWPAGGGAWRTIVETPGVRVLPGRDSAGAATFVADSTANRPLWVMQQNGEFWYTTADAYAITRHSPAGDSLSSIVLGLNSPPRALRASRQNELWVRIDAASPDSVEWHAFDMFGALRFRVQLPRNVAVHAVDADTLIASSAASSAGGFSVGRYVVRH